MKGLRVVAVYVGIAWFLASAGVLWSGIAAYGDASSQRDNVKSASAKQIAEVEEEKKELEGKLNEEIADVEQGVTEAKDERDAVAEDDKRGLKAAEAKVTKAEKAVDKATKAKEEAVAAIDEKLEGIRAEEKAQLEAMAGPGGAEFPWKAIVGLVLGILFIVAGVILKSGPSGSRSKRADSSARDPAFTKDLGGTSPAPQAIDDDEDTPPAGALPRSESSSWASPGLQSFGPLRSRLRRLPPRCASPCGSRSAPYGAAARRLRPARAALRRVA